MRPRIGLLWDASSDNVGDRAVGRVALRRLERLGFSGRVVALDPARPEIEDPALCWLAGGELLHPAGHPYYDLFRPRGAHVLFGVGTYGRPEAGHLGDYLFASVRSRADLEALADAGDGVEVVPCVTTLIADDLEPRDPAPAAGRTLVHLHAGVASEGLSVEARALLDTLGGDAALLSFTPYNADYAILEPLARAFGLPLLRPRDPDEAFTWIRAARGLVCASLHASIFAYVAGVPFLTLDYAGKIGRFLDERGLAGRRVARLAETVGRLDKLAPASVDWSETLDRDRARVAESLERAAGAVDRALTEAQSKFPWRPAAAIAPAHATMVALHAEHGLRVGERLAHDLERDAARSYAHRLETLLATSRGEVERLTKSREETERRLAAEGERAERLAAELAASRRRASTLASQVGALSVERERWLGPAVHVVIVHHRDGAVLDLALRALAASLAVRLGVVVVRNGRDAGEVPDWARAQRWLTVLDLERPHGFGAANNRGVEHAARVFGAAEFLFFLNDDAAVRPESVRWLVDHLTLHPECAVVGPRLTVWGAEDHLNSLGLNLTEVAEAWDEGIGLAVTEYGPLPPAREVAAVTGAALMIRAAVFRRLGGWNELYQFYFEDLDLCLRAWRAGHTVRHLTDAEVAHRISATAGQASPFKRYLSWRNQFLLLAAHWPTARLLGLLPRLVAAQLGVFGKRLAARCWSDAGLQARAWIGALARLPRIAGTRFGQPRRAPWARFLRPAGTVPVIRLPEVAGLAAPFAEKESP